MIMLVPVTSAIEISEDNHLTSKAAIVIDFQTGIVIYEYNADEQRVPASMTKVAAAYVIFDAIRDGVVSFETFIEVSESASKFSYSNEYINVPMPPDSSYSVRELLDAVIVRSACAATVVLGEGIFGSEDVLIGKMNDKANELGITAEFYDSWRFT